MTSTETIAGVARQHLFTIYPGTIDCDCGVFFSPVDPDDDSALIDWWSAHVAAAIAEALGSNDDGLRERVEALAEEWERSNFATIWRGAAQLRAALNGATS